MPSKFTINWHQPLHLREARKEENLIYACDELKRVPPKPGIYVFAKRFGKSIRPLYIGQSTNLQLRIKQHLENNVGLMKGIQHAAKVGPRLLLVGVFVPAPGLSAPKVIKLLEKAYIEHALTAGYDLLNELGTKTASHEIQSKGKKGFHAPFPRHMNLKIK